MDNAATSFPKPPPVLAAMMHYATHLGASAGRGAYAEAIEAGRIISCCRRRLNELFNGENADHFIFTLNCTDALNLAIKGIVLAAARKMPTPHCICTEIDHNSILRPLNALADDNTIELTRVRVDPSIGLIDLDDLRRSIRPSTTLIAITHASNVTGTLQPLRTIGRMARERGVPLLVDAAQSAGHVPIDVQADCVDLLAAPGHKGLLGPLGTGLLYIRPGLENRMITLREGGTGSMSEDDRQPAFMPDRFEPGSHNAIGIAGLDAALEWLAEETIEKISAHEFALMRRFLAGVNGVDGLRLFGPQTARDRLGVFSVRVDGMTPAQLSAALEDQFGILTRPGLHCAPIIHRALGTLSEGGTTRLSFGPFLSNPDVKLAAEALAEIASNTLAAAPTGG